VNRSRARILAHRLAPVCVGVLYALALPPFGLSLLAWGTLVPLLLCTRGRSARAAFAPGAVAGFAMAWAVGWWLPQAVARYFAAGMIPAVLVSAVYSVAFATTFGLFAAGTVVIRQWPHATLGRLAQAALWVALELVRARVFDAPWELLGYTQAPHTALIQLATLTGTYGISFLVALGNVAIADGLVALLAGQPRRVALTPLRLPAALVALVWAGGMAVTPTQPSATDAKARPVAVVQANMPPAFHWTREFAERQLFAHLHTSEALAEPALVVWPEDALSLYLESDPFLAAQIADLAERHHADVLFGAPRYENGHIFNSARLITSHGTDGGHYDKQHLVRFAEQGLVADAPTSDPSESPSDFTPGSAPGVLGGFVPLGISICHELLYPEVISASVAAGAELLVNIANDGWLDGGYGVASRQHFGMGVLRAVETRRYLVRAATTGVSGVIDPYGRILGTLAPGTVGTLTAPVVGQQVITPYVRLGDVFAFGCAIAAIGALLASRRVLAWRATAVLAPIPQAS
jgi:apolipoprotein N-acyltransferase